MPYRPPKSVSVHAVNPSRAPQTSAIALFMRVRNAAVMHLSHLGLPVRGLRRSQQFYSAYFGFDPATAQEYEDGTVMIRNADGFDPALHPVGQLEPSPAFLHAGFTATGPAEVRALMERREADGVIIVERNDEAADPWRAVHAQ